MRGTYGARTDRWDWRVLISVNANSRNKSDGIAFLLDMDKTWAEYDLAEFGPRSLVRFRPKNSDAWFRVELRKGWIERAEVLFIKRKP